VDYLGLNSGRFSAVLRGAARKTRGGTPSGLAQPFTPLLLKAAGRGELRSVHQVELAGTAITLQGKAVFKGLYTNELLVRTLPRYDPHPRLFAAYGDLLPALSRDDEGPLREFELALLDDLGYELIFAHDTNGDLIDPQIAYCYHPASGFTSRTHQQTRSADVVSRDGPEGLDIPGSVLLALSSWRHGGRVMSEYEQQWLKRITRRALAQHLGHKPLKSRELFAAFVRGGLGKTSADVNP